MCIRDRLYAAGETACVSVHGGNRLGANSLLDTLIFGRRAGAHAAREAKAMAMPTAAHSQVEDEERAIDTIVRRERSGRRVSEVKAELGKIMDARVAVYRDDEGLKEALEVIKRLQEEAKTVAIDDKGTVFNQDVLERKESRGAQYRTDFPDRNDDEWLKHITVTHNGSGDGDVPELAYSEVTLTQWQPLSLIHISEPTRPY